MPARNRSRSARRRSSRAPDVSTNPSGDESSAAVASNGNGNGKSKSPAKPKATPRKAAKDEIQENIFLFWPNIIGMYLPALVIHDALGSFILRRNQLS